MSYFTNRQQQIIKLSLNGLTNKEIARELNLSPETIKTHVRLILKKTKIPRLSWWKLLYSENKGLYGEWQPVKNMPKFGSFIVGNAEKGLVAPYFNGVIMNSPGTQHDWDFGVGITHFKDLGPPPKRGT